MPLSREPLFRLIVFLERRWTLAAPMLERVSRIGSTRPVHPMGMASPPAC